MLTLLTLKNRNSAEAQYISLNFTYYIAQHVPYNEKN